MELRKRVMARLGKDESARQVAAALDMAPSSVVKLSQRLRLTGSCAPAGTEGHPPRRIAGTYEAWMLERVQKLTLSVLQKLQPHGRRAGGG